jgi:addiction module HigA family antidote
MSRQLADEEGCSGVKAVRVEAPQHPGCILRSQLHAAFGLSVSQAARDLGISRSALHRVLAGDAGVTPEMAARLARLTGVPARDWLTRQAAHDLWHVERTLAGDLSRVPARQVAQRPGGGR